MRLDALLAQELGVKKAAAEELIREGRVAICVDGRPVTSPAFQVLLGGVDTVTVDGRELHLATGSRHFHRILLLHKPPGVVCTRSSQARGGDGKAHHRDIYSAVPPKLRHRSLCTFGRLDRDTTGLYLLGTDGGLQALLLHPATKLPKTYLAGLDPHYPLSEDAVRRFREGLVLANGHRCEPSAMEVLERGFAHDDVDAHIDGRLPPATLVRVTVNEGKYHQVKKMIGCCGGFVASLHRQSLGSLILDPLELLEGECRHLTPRELRLLKEGLPFHTRTAPAELEAGRRKIIRERYARESEIQNARGLNSSENDAENTLNSSAPMEDIDHANEDDSTSPIIKAKENKDVPTTKSRVDSTTATEKKDQDIENPISTKPKPDSTNTIVNSKSSQYSITLFIKGMTCSGCVKVVDRVLNSFEFVESTTTDLFSCTSVLYYSVARLNLLPILQMLDDVGMETYLEPQSAVDPSVTAQSASASSQRSKLSKQPKQQFGAVGQRPQANTPLSLMDELRLGTTPYLRRYQCSCGCEGCICSDHQVHKHDAGVDVTLTNICSRLQDTLGMSTDNLEVAFRESGGGDKELRDRLSTTTFPCGCGP